MKASETATLAIEELAGVHAALALILERKKPVSHHTFHELAAKLKRAAEILDKPHKEKTK